LTRLEVRLTVAGEKVETTPEHPWYTAGKGWVNAGELRIGEHIRRADGSYGEVQSLEFIYQPKNMYNLTVEKAHTFFVGVQQWLVHNKNPICYFRGTTEGYPGSPALQQRGVTPVSTDPVVSSIFAIHGQQYGKGLLYIATARDLRGIKIGRGNVLSTLEVEFAPKILPLQFARKASFAYKADEAREALIRMGVKLPSVIRNPSAVQQALENSPRFNKGQIIEFLNNLGLEVS